MNWSIREDGKTMGERFYPFEHKEEKKEETGKEPVGKGRRDGNSKASVVIHSGNFKEKKEPRREETPAVSAKPGDRLTLRVGENTNYGSFLRISEDKKVLLPFAEQTVRPKEGDTVEVTLYEDKGGRLTATMRAPIIKEGETGVLKVAAVTKIGVFADNGMPKQVLVPFKELLHTPEPGDEILVYLYKDKSGREAGTMRVYKHLQRMKDVKEDDRVEGFVYEVNKDLGVFVAVEDKYYGMIPGRENFSDLSYGDRVSARVSKVREDGKLDLLLRDKLYTTANKDADRILEELKENGGMLPYADRASAELIKETYAMSKNQFKRALGYLYKKRLVEIDREADRVKLLIQF